MKKSIVAMVAVAAAVIAIRQINRSTPQPRVPYYNYD
jgi:hypothetical protein